MFKIIVADDNPLIRMGIKSMINWGELHTELVGEADRGDEILELLDKKQTDLLITDIRMPGKDGLYVLKQVQIQYPDLETIVISAYDEFDYVKQALKAGSVDYILKPVDPDELNAAIAKAQNRQRPGKNRTMEYEAGQGMVVAVLQCRTEYALSELGSILKNYEKISIMKYEDFFILSYPEEMYPFSDIENTLRNNLSENYLLGKACIASEISYEQAVKDAKRYANEKMIKAAAETKTPQRIRPDMSEQRFCMENIVVLCKSGGSGELLDIYHEIREDILLSSNGDIEIWERGMENFLNILSVLDNHASFGIQQILHKVRNQREKLSYVAQIELDVEVEKAIIGLCELFSRKKGSKEDLVFKVKEFVDSCYAQDISPGSIARLFNVSLPYLSKIFKQETGKNLNFYITDIRISRAQYLLANTNKNVSDIASMVGYEDVNYFIRIYKKLTGITPSKSR